MANSHGKHVYIDYVGYQNDERHDGKWMLELLVDAVNHAGVRSVHSRVEEFDGSVSPSGFAAVVLLDESHVSAHCYYEKGWLALDAFTCGDNDPMVIAKYIEDVLASQMPALKQMRREVVERFLHEDIEAINED